MSRKKTMLIVPAANNMNFLADIAEALKERYEIDILYTGKETFPLTKEYDYIWLEWADGLPLYFAYKLTKLKDTKVILRIHSYELRTQRTLDVISKINPDIIDKLIFVSDYMKQIGVSKFPWMKKGIVLPNLIDHTKFLFKVKVKGYDILFLGRISYVKNLPFLMQLFYELLQYNLEYKLHIVGNISDQELYYFKENFICKVPFADYSRNIIFYNRIEHSKIPEFIQNMDYIVCTSIFESQGVGIIEGMCAGLKPVVYNFGGAEEFYKPEHLFLTRAEFLNRILKNDYKPREYHDYAVKNFSIQENLWKYIEVIER